MSDPGLPDFKGDSKEAQGEVSKVKQRLSAHVQHRMAHVLNEPSSSTEVNSENYEEKMINCENIKLEKDDGHDANDAGATSSQGEPSNAPSPVHHVQQGQSASSGSFMAGSLMLSNSILDEVLNEKKLALLQSPDVIRFLREAQKKTG